jgi:hypothetical protein
MKTLQQLATNHCFESYKRHDMTQYAYGFTLVQLESLINEVIAQRGIDSSVIEYVKKSKEFIKECIDQEYLEFMARDTLKLIPDSINHLIDHKG